MSVDPAPGKPKPLLVLLAGFFGGKAMFTKCYGPLFPHFTVFALDLYGIGR